MTHKYQRLVLLAEFFLAVIAIFTGWSEIGGQATLDVMPWGWKFGLGLGLAVVSVAYTAAIATEESIWNSRSARWLGLALALLVAMAVVTYLYSQRVEPSDGGMEEQEQGSSLHSRGPLTPRIYPVGTRAI